MAAQPLGPSSVRGSPTTRRRTGSRIWGRSSSWSRGTHWGPSGPAPVICCTHGGCQVDGCPGTERSPVCGKSQQINSLAPRRPGCHFKTAIFNFVLLIGISTLSKDNALRWMPRDLTDDKSTLVQVMAWYRQATSHYLSQCWASSMSPYGVTRPQWVNT